MNQSIITSIKIFFSFCTVVFMLSGCSVKQNDNTATKTVKHIANSPLYVIMGIGIAGTIAGGAVGYGISNSIDALNGYEIYADEIYLGKQTELALDTNASLTKIYTNDDFAMFKDDKNINYLLDKSNQDFIKNVLIGGKRYKLGSGVRLPFRKVLLEKLDLDKKEIFEKFSKDEFGNPTYLGSNVVLKVKQSRQGWLMSLYTNIYLIPNGANSVGRQYDENIPDDIQKQMNYYFPANKNDL